jgi:RNA recognition motif-containing protein
MKKRLRQVQLEMTKLRARQAEVSKEVKKTPVSGMRPLLFQPSQEDINARSIFVSNVHFAATKAALAVHFGHCGEIVRVTLLADVATGKPKGSAYVEFSTKEAVKKALALNESSLLSRTLKVVRKDDAAVEMITPPIVHASMQRSHPPIAHPFSRDSVLRGKLHMLRRPAGMRKPFSGTSHLQWKREGSLTGASANDGVAMATGQRFGHGPVRLTRSLSYVRVAPYATH